MAMLAAFNTTAVNRLKTTFMGVKKKSMKVLKQLGELFDSSGSYKNYRAVLEKTQGPAVPYMYFFFSIIDSFFSDFII